MRIGLVPAAGKARRLGISRPKELLHYRGKPIIEYNVDHLVAAGVDQIVVVIREGKEVIRNHLLRQYPQATFNFVYQRGKIGNLIDAIKASYEQVQGHQVCFAFADTYVQPNPFLHTDENELTLLCFRSSGSQWQHFGVVDPQQIQVVDKPRQFISHICWGALAWQPPFLERLMASDDLTAVMNQTRFAYRMAINEYRDIGVKKTPSMEPYNSVELPTHVFGQTP